MPLAEHDRVLNQVFNEEMTAAQSAASVARFRLEPNVGKLEQRYRQLVDRSRRDVALSFPNALDHIDANGMLTYGLLREKLADRIGGRSRTALCPCVRCQECRGAHRRDLD
jgi:hypothetical protein